MISRPSRTSRKWRKACDSARRTVLLKPKVLEKCLPELKEYNRIDLWHWCWRRRWSSPGILSNRRVGKLRREWQSFCSCPRDYHPWAFRLKSPSSRHEVAPRAGPSEEPDLSGGSFWDQNLTIYMCINIWTLSTIVHDGWDWIKWSLRQNWGILTPLWSTEHRLSITDGDDLGTWWCFIGWRVVWTTTQLKLQSTNPSNTLAMYSSNSRWSGSFTAVVWVKKKMPRL